MYRAVPGKILSLSGDDPILRVGRVDFGGMVKAVNPANVPEARIGNSMLDPGDRKP